MTLVFPWPSERNQKYSVNSQESWYVASYRFETSAVQAFKMPWKLNIPHTVTGNTPGEVGFKKSLTF